MNNNKTGDSEKINYMSVTRLLECIKEESGANQRFCFILGSGASYTAGIKTGVKLMKEWREYLKGKGEEYIKDCARAANYEWEECKGIFEGEIENLKNEDYFTLYDIRFVGCPTVGYAALESEMEGKAPNIGYYYLAKILTETDNRLVITTNFDSLTEDALFYYRGHHPLVLGHEKLASYVASVDRKPVVAKIHRDLLMDPMSHKRQMERLQEEWEKPLSAALSRYIPIVIGYAGGDKTLMTLLDKLKLKGIFWCTLEREGEKGLPEKAKNIIRNNHGHWVKIKGFDELMFLLADSLNIMPDLDEMNKAMNERHKSIQEGQKKLEKEYKGASIKRNSEEALSEDTEMYQAMIQEDLLSDAWEVFVAGDKARGLELCNKVIEQKPELAEAYDYRSAMYHREKDYESALNDANKAIELEPENAEYYCSRGVTLHEMKRYEDALKDKNTAIELEPENARYYSSRSVTLHEMKRYEEALKDSDKALELDSENARYYKERGVTLHEMKRYEDALKDKNTAIELEPENARYYSSRSATLHEMKRYEEALRDINKALELEPENTIYTNAQKIVLEKLKNC